MSRPPHQNGPVERRERPECEVRWRPRCGGSAPVPAALRWSSVASLCLALVVDPRWCFARTDAGGAAPAEGAERAAPADRGTPRPSVEGASGELSAPGEPTERDAPQTTESAPADAAKTDIGVAAGLDRARNYYQEGRFDSCAESYGELFGRLKAPDKEIAPELLEDARVHYAACLLAIGERQAADEQMRKAMEENPLMASPDPVVFPAAVRDLFFQVKSDFLEEIGKAQEEELQRARREEALRQERARQERLRVERLERLAAQELVVHQNQRWIAAIPFGVGQFQNGDTALGGVFLTSELLLLGATVAAVSRQLQVHSLAEGGTEVQDARAFNDPIQLAHSVELWAGAGFLLVASIGVLEAQLNFVEEIERGSRERRPRPPKPSAKAAGPRITPQVSHVEGGALLGVGGRF